MILSLIHSYPGRKTQWSLITVQKGERLVNLDSQVPNRLAAQWVREGGLRTTPAGLQAERTFGDSRFDLAFQLEGRRCFLEVKGVTLERDGTACFPDAPTARGAKHLRGLKQAAQMGYGAYVPVSYTHLKATPRQAGRLETQSHPR